MLSAPQIIYSPTEIKNLSSRFKNENKIIGFVPTMGCLHEGHLSLMREAKKQCDIVIVSIFVNPMQFGPNEDFASYPRTLERDVSLCQSVGVDVVFAPLKTELYPQGFNSKILGGPIAELYCGKSRPGFFDGILTVVNILFQIVQPHKAFFGEKDFQQLFLVKQMVRDLWMSVDVIGLPIVREADGLAMSSRNTYLTSEQRKHATSLYRAILSVQKQVNGGETSISKLQQTAHAILEATPDFVIDYIVFVGFDSFLPMTQELDQPARLLLAGYLGNQPRIRLIDNILIN